MGETNRPVAPCIGILVIDLNLPLTLRFGKQWYSYVPAGYVKFLESAGAFVVPVWIGRERYYYRHMLSQLNGILLPGGGIAVDNKELELTNHYIQSAYYIYDVVLEMNRAGNCFPLWGTCLGFQLLLMHVAKNPEVRTECESIRTALPLLLAKDYRESALLGELPDRLAREMDRVPFACHNHKHCISTKKLDELNLSRDWRVLATRCDDKGQEIITLIEHRCYPLFGSQFHPERVAFEQVYSMENICGMAHSRICIEMSQFMGNSFVEFCRRSKNRFASTEQMSRHLIWNWQPIFTGQFDEFRFLQAYIFEKNVDYPRDKTVKAQCDCMKPKKLRIKS